MVPSGNTLNGQNKPDTFIAGLKFERAMFSDDAMTSSNYSVRAHERTSVLINIAATTHEKVPTGCRRPRYFITGVPRHPINLHYLLKCRWGYCLHSPRSTFNPSYLPFFRAHEDVCFERHAWLVRKDVVNDRPEDPTSRCASSTGMPVGVHALVYFVASLWR